MAKKFTLPDLPYAYNALEPVISSEIMELHHKKHHNTYVTKLNEALEKYAQAEASEDLSTMISLQPAIRFNGGGHINHSIFWTNLAPPNKGGGERPSGELADAINKRWDSFENFVEAFNNIAAPIQGSGWCWLGFCKTTHHLIIETCSNQDPLLGTKNAIPLLGIDVWEHAYYLQYKNARPDYLKAIWKVVNWSNVAQRYEECAKSCPACVK
ncbi:MAG: superoxide dismutase [Chlamydiales bacterium]|nr:superoxide dismutase [Chlamydiales bacterium]